jgi:OmpR family response regulator NblR
MPLLSKYRSKVPTMSAFNPAILLVQTEETFAQQAILELDDGGYIPFVIPKADRAWREFKNQEPAMIILDRSRSGEAGIKFCHQVRSSGSRVLILLLLEAETIGERVACLEAGADDYLLKSYHIKEVLQRIHFYLQPKQTNTEQLRFSDLILDLNNHCLILNNKAIDLTVKEFELLKYFMSHPREILTREKILENVWGSDFQGESNVIEVYIRYLRLKMEREHKKRLIHTVRGMGYVLRET